MLSFVQNFFAPKINPIGVDFGTDCLRLAQVAPHGDGEHKLIAAASADVPGHVRNNQSARMQFFVETARDLLAQGNFRSRQAVLAMPAAGMFIQHLRLPKLDEEETRKALPWEARGKLPIDPSQALLRHLIAGEVYQDQDPKNEVILMAASRENVNQFLAAAAKAKLDVVGMNVEPKALIDCFGHIYRRNDDQNVTNCFIDIGCGSTRAVIARGTDILFARSIPIGADHFNRAAAAALSISIDEAKMKRLQYCQSAQQEFSEQKSGLPNSPPPPPTPAPAPAVVHDSSRAPENSFALLEASMRASSAPQAPAAVIEQPAESHEAIEASGDDEMDRMNRAIAEPVHKLIGELDLCRRYYEATFQNNKPVDRLIFVGGEARQRGVCLQIARELGLAAQIGDPMVRMGRISEIGIETGIDRRQPQPGWAIAIGLSMGPPRGGAKPGASEAKKQPVAAKA